MIHLLTAVCLLSFGVYQGNEWRPTDQFLKAVRQVESSDGQFVYGDGGESLGDFQLSEAAWLDVNAWRRARSLKTYRYDRSVMNQFINRVYASNYLSLLHSELNRRLGRPPNHAELYAAYNLGLGSFAQLDFNLRRVNAVTRARCRQIGDFLTTAQPSL